MKPLWQKILVKQKNFITSFLLVISIPTSQLYKSSIDWNVELWSWCEKKYLWNITKQYLSSFTIRTYIFYNVAYINQVCYFHQKCFKHSQHLKLIIDFKTLQHRKSNCVARCLARLQLLSIPCYHHIIISCAIVTITS